MNRILILGCDGMLGSMVASILSRDKTLKVLCTNPEATDGNLKFKVNLHLDELRKIFDINCGFDYVINCIGILNNNINEDDSQSVRRAILINSLFPHNLASLAQDAGANVIQISTDGVFARDAGACMEDSRPNCNDVYGKTKNLGEVCSPNFLNIRCSIIGPSPNLRKGLLEWFLSQPNGAKVNGYTDQKWTGITTLQFAKLCRLLISTGGFNVVRDEAPTHHFCPNKVVTKYKLLQLFKSYFRPDIVIKPITNPENKVNRFLDTKFLKINEIFGYDFPMQYAIEELAKEI